MAKSESMMSALNCKAGGRGFKRTEILAWSDSNIAGSEWRWSIYLTERKDKTFSLGAKLAILDDPGYRIPVIYPLRNGAQLKKAIEDLYTDDQLSIEGINWNFLIKNIKRSYPRLAEQIRQAFIDEAEAERREEAEHEAQELRDRPVDDWVALAEWPRSTLFGFGGMGHSIDNGRRRVAVRQYAKNYLAEHGELPAGVHVVDDSVLHDKPGVYGAQGGDFEFEVIFSQVRGE
jgi:hypothetical protein